MLISNSVEALCTKQTVRTVDMIALASCLAGWRAYSQLLSVMFPAGQYSTEISDARLVDSAWQPSDPCDTTQELHPRDKQNVEESIRCGWFALIMEIGRKQFCSSFAPAEMVTAISSYRK